jgi:hypothetical protein
MHLHRWMYGISRWAEQGLREIAAQTGMEVVIIRPHWSMGRVSEMVLP